MEIYFSDRKFNILAVASTDGSGKYKVSDDHEITDYETNITSFSGIIHFTQEQILAVKEFSTLGNYVFYRKVDGTIACYTIMEINHSPLDGTREFKCEDGALDLLNNVVGETTSVNEQPLSFYLAEVLRDTGFVVGQNYLVNLKRTLSYTNEQTALERLRAILADFGGAKFTIDFEFSNNKISRKVINILEDVGEKKSITLRVDKDVNSITTTGNIYDLMTAIKPLGNALEGSDNAINLIGYSWTDPEGRFKLSDGVLVDTLEAPKWSRLLNTSEGLFKRVIKYDTIDKSELISNALRDLRKNSQPQFNYDVSVVKAPDGIYVGDTINIVDEVDELFLSGKVLQIDRSTADETTDITLGDFLIQQPGFNAQLIQIANEFKQQINDNTPSIVEVIPSKQFFVNGNGSISLTAKVTKGSKDITNDFTSFIWKRYDANNVIDTGFNATGKSINVTAGTSNVYTYYVSVDY